MVEKHFGHQIKNLYSDNGGEFVAMRSLLATHGISHYTSPPHTPEHNGIAERKHRHIVETGLTLLHQAELPPQYWTYSFATAVYLINRLPSPVTENQSPYMKLFNRPPNYLKLRVFGCLCYHWLRPYTKHKMENRSLPCVFLGYSLTQSAYLCLHVPTGRLYTSRHVQFVETQFPYSKPVLPTPQTSDTSSPAYAPPTHIPLSPPLVQQLSSSPPCADPPSHQPLVSTADTVVADNTGTNSTCNIIGSAQVHEQGSNIDQQPHQTDQQPPLPIPTTPLLPAQTEQQPPLPITTTTTAHNPEPTPMSSTTIRNVHPMRTRAKNQISKPTQKRTLSCHHPTKTHNAYIRCPGHARSKLAQIDG